MNSVYVSKWIKFTFDLSAKKNHYKNNNLSFRNVYVQPLRSMFIHIYIHIVILYTS